MSDKSWAKRKLDGISGDGDEEGNSAFFQTKSGRNILRFLPRIGEDQFFLEVYGHYFAGRWFRCLTRPETFVGKNKNTPPMETKCPLCKRFNKERNRLNRKYERGSEEGKQAYGKIARLYAPKCQYYALVYDASAEELVVKTFRFGSQILSQLLTQYIDANVEFFSIKRGRNVIVKKKKLGDKARDVEYTVVMDGQREDITDLWRQIKGDLPDLEESVGAPLSAEEINATIAEIEADDDEDEDEKPARRRSRDDEDDEPVRKKKTKSRDDDDEDDDKEKDEEDDDDDEDEDDDDDRPPIKKKSSPALDKVKRRLKRDDDEDDD